MVPFRWAPLCPFRGETLSVPRVCGEDVTVLLFFGNTRDADTGSGPSAVDFCDDGISDGGIGSRCVSSSLNALRAEALTEGGEARADGMWKTVINERQADIWMMCVFFMSILTALNAPNSR